MRFKKGHLYLTPVKKKFSLYDDPQDQLLHTCSHVFTTPPVSHFTEIEVVEGSLLADAVGYSREHITRSFFAAYHTTPKHYFEQARMSAALRRLLEGKK